MSAECSGRVVERRSLPPVPESARAARETVHEALAAVGRADLADAAGLLVSELVTNAIVHARTTIGLHVAAGPDGLHVAVRDGSTALPVQRHYGRVATTGRGLGLVELMSDRHGTDSHPVEGKTVWFELGASLRDDSPASDEVPADVVADLSVRLLGLPVGLSLAWQQHADALLREHLLSRWDVAATREGNAADVVADDVAAGEALAAVAAALAALGAPGGLPPHVDLELSLRSGAAEGFDELDVVLEHVMELAQRGLTLAPPTQPETRLLRRWVCEQVRSQAAGAAPAAWPGLPPESPPADVAPVDWDTTAVRTATEAVVAADDVNRIVAASPAALALLGWDGDLVGRRIVALIPHRFRESHIASFTMHLLTGETRIIDREVTVPALRRDGTEVSVRLEVRREAVPGGRTIFTATMRPC